MHQPTRNGGVIEESFDLTNIPLDIPGQVIWEIIGEWGTQEIIGECGTQDRQQVDRIDNLYTMCAIFLETHHRWMTQ